MKKKKHRKHAPKSSLFFDVQFITSGMSTTLVLLLLGLVVFFVLSAHNLSNYVRENIQFSVLLSEEVTEADIAAMQKRFEQAPFVKRISYVSKQQALEEYSQAMGSNPKEFLGHNPFKRAINIRLNAQYANADSIAAIEKLIKQDTDIQEILYRKELIHAVDENTRTISFILLGLAGILTCISFVLINNTIRLAIYSKRFLIHTMKLVGAEWSFIRRPFVRKQIWSGILAAFVANVLLLGAASWLLTYKPGLKQVITWDILAIMCVSILASGIFITWLCAYLSMNRYLKMKSHTLHYI